MELKRVGLGWWLQKYAAKRCNISGHFYLCKSIMKYFVMKLICFGLKHYLEYSFKNVLIKARRHRQAKLFALLVVVRNFAEQIYL